MRNVYWTIKYKNGWLDTYCVMGLRKESIARYLSVFTNGRKKDWDWKRHKRVDGLSVVRVQIVEVENFG